jgi:hypothetical protein
MGIEMSASHNTSQIKHALQSNLHGPPGAS